MLFFCVLRRIYKVQFQFHNPERRKGKAITKILNVFGMTRPGIERAASRTEAGFRLLTTGIHWTVVNMVQLDTFVWVIYSTAHPHHSVNVVGWPKIHSNYRKYVPYVLQCNRSHTSALLTNLNAVQSHQPYLEVSNTFKYLSTVYYLEVSNTFKYLSTVYYLLISKVGGI